MMGRVAMEMYQGQHKEQEAIKNRLREANRAKLIKKAEAVGIPFDWMFPRISSFTLNRYLGAQTILDLWVEKLDLEFQDWYDTELSMDQWDKEFDLEFKKVER